MERTMTTKASKKQLEALEAQRLIRDQIANESRARSVTVGTAFGGTTELGMRTDYGVNIWCLMQPVEVVELIHQLAANVGCHVALKPRKDFASWRDWRVSEEEHERLNGWAPWVNDMSPYNQLGAQGMDPDILKALNAGAQLVETGGGAGGGAGTKNAGQPGANAFDLEAFKRSKENVVATKKAVNKRTTKRPTKAA